MAFDWLKSGLLARRGYGKAIEQLQQQLKKRRNDPRLQLQLAEVFIQANRKKDALPLLEAVADEFALQGFAARAIAILKRIRQIAPENTQAEEKLAYLISQQENPQPAVWRTREERPGLELGMEEFEDGEMGMESGIGFPAFAEASAAAPESGVPEPGASEPSVPEPGAEESAIDAVSAMAAPFGLDLNDETVRHEFLTLLDIAFTPPSADEAAVAQASQSAVAVFPLFSDFKPEELIAVMRGLELEIFDPGEIIVSQGEAGDSLFILASGRARAYLKDGQGRNVQVRALAEGDFFGEIALMTGGPRTATITAETRCELLLLDRKGLDGVAKYHPRVREVLQEFYVKRVSMSIDQAAQRAKVP